MRAKVGEPMAFLLAALETDTDECILWPYATYRNGYAKVRFGGRMEYGHRMVMRLLDVDPDGWHVRHSCDVRPCVNPRHLLLGTREENMADMVRRGRQVRGSASPQAKLTEQQVQAIRCSTESQRALVARFGVSQSAICLVRRGVIWRHCH